MLAAGEIHDVPAIRELRQLPLRVSLFGEKQPLEEGSRPDGFAAENASDVEQIVADLDARRSLIQYRCHAFSSDSLKSERTEAFNDNSITRGLTQIRTV